MVVTDTDPRGKAPGEVAELVRQGLHKGGFTDDSITIVLDGREATRAALDMAVKGDIVVLQADDVQLVIQDVMDYKEKIMRKFEEEVKAKQEKVPYGED